MLDWAEGIVGYDAAGMRFGHVLEVDSEGVVVKDRPGRGREVGSFEGHFLVSPRAATSAMLAAADRLGFRCATTSLYMSGNPSKFLQGHNVVGPSSAKVGPLLVEVVRQFKEFRPVDADEPGLPAFHRSRLDVTTSCDLGSDQAVHDWLHMAAASMRSRSGRAQQAGLTVYFGQHSTRWTLKMYCKSHELLVHPPSELLGPVLLAELAEWAVGKLRVELTLRTKELKPLGTVHEPIIWEYFRRLEVPNVKSERAGAESLKAPVRLALQGFLRGTDLKAMLARPTFYRYRRAILDATGIDISLSIPADHGGPDLLGLEELMAREVHDQDLPPLMAQSIAGQELQARNWGRR